MDDIKISQAMIDAAAKAYEQHRVSFNNLADAGEADWFSWRCLCGESSRLRQISNKEETVKEGTTHVATVLLAAAFAECEVREEFGALWPGGTFHRSADLVGGFRRLAEHYPGATPARRLVITTPPVVVTPTQEETAT